MARLASITVRGSVGHNHYTPAQFAALALGERIQLLMAGKVEFFDEAGQPMPSFEAVEQLPRPDFGASAAK